MGLWLSLWLAPLISLSVWWMNTAQHWTSFQSEQIRLDAVSLSLCHSRRNYIQEEVLSLNELLTSIASEMTVTAVTCSGPTTAACFATTKTLLGALSSMAQAIQFQQDTKLALYPSLEQEKLRSLMSENGIRQGSLRIMGVWQAGPLGAFKRASLSELQQALEWRWGLPWPRPLVVSGSYSLVNQFELAYVPARLLANSKLKAEKIKTKPSSLSTSKTGCQIEAPPEARIRRTL